MSGIIYVGRARRGASGTLNPKSAIAGRNSLLRLFAPGSFFLNLDVDSWALCGGRL